MSYRLIDSNAIADKYPEVNDMPCVFADLPNGLDGSFIDIQPVVRCKDCNKKGQSLYREDGTEFIVCWNLGYGISHPIDWYCADGEREDDD